MHLLLLDEDFVRVTAGYLKPPYHDRSRQVLLLGDNEHTPYQITDTSKVITVDPFKKITVAISCSTPPLTLCKHSPFQMYISPGQDPDSNNFDVYFSHILSREKPNIQANISQKDKYMDITLMADTGANVTTIPRAKSPCDWELVPSCGSLQHRWSHQLPLQQVSGKHRGT